MPKYLLRCTNKHQVERTYGFSEFDQKRKEGFKCPLCGKPAVIQLSYFALGRGLAHNESYPNDKRGAARKRAAGGKESVGQD